MYHHGLCIITLFLPEANPTADHHENYFFLSTPPPPWAVPPTQHTNLRKESEAPINSLPHLVSDLALILVVAGAVTLLFKKLRQPLVLGYIVAGFLVSPHMPYTMSVVDKGDVEMWAEIGVMFLLFSLGLDFSVKKILKMGTSPVIAACTIVFSMILLGITVGKGFGWGHMDCIFLGGMLAMSSTTIIYKALSDMGLLQQGFVATVMSVCILEDILAIVMMVMLSAIANGSSPDGGQLLGSVFKIGFFLVLWFVIGIFLIPLLLRKVRKLMNAETLLIVALGLCCLMAVISTKVGFSSAFGAFVMGSILAETVEADKIIRLVEPVKNLFGAIFFVSVGMLVDPLIIVDYALPILCLVLTILAGQAVFGTMGYLLGGQSLKNAMRCGFSMAQVGEFAFIIASLGLSLGVIGTGAPATPSSGHLWKRLLRAMVVNTLIYGILSIAVIALMFSFALPFCRELSTELTGSHWAGNAVCGIATVLMIAPFLRAFMMKKNHSEEFKTLWTERRTNRPPLVFTVLVRLAIAAAYIFYIANYLTRFADALLITIAFGTIVLMVLSRSLKKRSIRLERLFVQNLRSREIQAEALGRKRPLYEGRLLDREIHMSLCEVPEDSLWAGKQLAELDFRKHFGVNVSSILRGRQRINIPNGEVALFPGDQLQVIGDDDQLTRFAQAMRTEVHDEDAEIEKREMRLQQIIVGQKSPFLDQTLRESGIRDRYNCMVVGLDEGEKNLTIITPNYRFALGDVLWIVGEEQNVKGLLEANGEE